MHFLQRLRQASLITRFMLVWFGLSLGAAIASPFINPQPLELICASNGALQVLVKNADGGSSDASHSALDCPLCVSLAAAPLAAGATTERIQPLGPVFQASPTPHRAAHTAAPPPARGPPVFS